MKSDTQDWVAIGKIGRPKGLQGAMRVQLYNPQSDLLESGVEVSLGGVDHPVLVTHAEPIVSRGSVRWLLELEGMTSRSSAEEWTGAEIFVRRSSLPKLPQGEYYWFDIIGLDVVTSQGESLGTLCQIMDTGANDVYVVRKGTQEWLLPAIGEVIREIDIHKGRIIADPQEVSDAV